MKATKYILIFMVWLWVPSSFADLAVIVHKNNVDVLDEQYLKKIFLGKNKGFPTAGMAVPLDLPADSPIRNIFLERVVNKSKHEFKSYWSKFMYRGDGVPPRIVESEQAVIALVTRNPSVIGYIAVGNITNDVRVVAVY